MPVKARPAVRTLWAVGIYMVRFENLLVVSDDVSMDDRSVCKMQGGMFGWYKYTRRRELV